MKSLCCEFDEEFIFPEFKGERVHMQEIDISQKLPVNLGRWHELIKKSLASIALRIGVIYLTIDEKIVNAGKTHRREGRHVDGNYISNWGGWLTESDHLSEYYSKTGGMLIASSYSSAQGWVGDFEGVPKKGGDCSEINTSSLQKVNLKENRLYLGNSTFIHESMPLDRTVKRQLFRITLPHDIDFEEILEA